MIVTQIDSSDVQRDGDVADDLVGFVEAEDALVKIGGAVYEQQRYFGRVYERPVMPNSPVLAYCGHQHREIHSAKRCVRRLLRKLTEERRDHA